MTTQKSDDIRFAEERSEGEEVILSCLVLARTLTWKIFLIMYNMTGLMFLSLPLVLWLMIDLAACHRWPLKSMDVSLEMRTKSKRMSHYTSCFSIHNWDQIYCCIC